LPTVIDPPIPRPKPSAPVSDARRCGSWMTRELSPPRVRPRFQAVSSGRRVLRLACKAGNNTSRRGAFARTTHSVQAEPAIKGISKQVLRCSALHEVKRSDEVFPNWVSIHASEIHRFAAVLRFESLPPPPRLDTARSTNSRRAILFGQQALKPDFSARLVRGQPLCPRI